MLDTDKARAYADHIQATGQTTIHLHPRGHYHHHKTLFRLHFLEALIGMRHQRNDGTISQQLDALEEKAKEKGYTLVDVDPEDYV